MAIVDWPTVATIREQERLRDWITEAGIPCILADPRDLTYDGQNLLAKGEPIDMIYRRLTTLDLVEHADAIQAMALACREGRVVVVGSFPADVAHSKKLFAFLTDERWQYRFSPAERALIEAHVPWTRILAPSQTLYRAKVYDLVELLLAQRERFVLKPSISQEGRGVVLGIDTTPQAWEQAVRQRLGSGDVVQEFVEAPIRTFYFPENGRIETRPMHLHLGEYMLGGKLGGILARASTELVLSASSRERHLPCLIVPEDEDLER